MYWNQFYDNFLGGEIWSQNEELNLILFKLAINQFTKVVKFIDVSSLWTWLTLTVPSIVKPIDLVHIYMPMALIGLMSFSGNLHT